MRQRFFLPWRKGRGENSFPYVNWIFLHNSLKIYNFQTYFIDLAMVKNRIELVPAGFSDQRTRVLGHPIHK